MILQVKDNAGKVLYDWNPPASATPIIDPRVAYLITDILSDNNARIPSFGDHSALQIGRPAAAKTGTTTDYRDNWTVGYTPNLVVGVWVGNADNSPMIKVSGVTGAGPIWNAFMRQVLNGQPELQFQRPEGLIQVEVCALSGLLPTDLCPSRKVEWFINGTEPKEQDNIFQKFAIDSATGLLATSNTPPERRIEKVYEVLPQEARDWGLRHGIEPPPVALHKVAGLDVGLRLLLPDPYTVYQLNPMLPLDSQKIRFSVAVPSDTKSVTYWIDGQQVETLTDAPFSTWWALIPGKHKLKATAALENGNTVTSEETIFTVLSFVPPDERPDSGEVK
jgi:membrane carboxypeptidase/penicillin-binding protein PbpC